MPGDVAEDVLENIFRQTLSEFLRNGSRSLVDHLFTDNAAWRDSFTVKVKSERVGDYQQAFADAGIDCKVQGVNEKEGMTTFLVKAADIDKVRDICASFNDLGAEIEEVKPVDVPLDPSELDDERAACFGEDGQIIPEKCKELFDKWVLNEPLLAENGVISHAELNEDGFIDQVYKLDLDNERVKALLAQVDMSGEDALAAALLATHKHSSLSKASLESIAASYGKESGEQMSELGRGWLERWSEIEHVDEVFVDFELDKEAFDKLKGSTAPEDRALAGLLEKMQVRPEEAQMEGLAQEAVEEAGGPEKPKETEHILDNDDVYTFKATDVSEIARLDTAFDAIEQSDISIYPDYELSFREARETYSRKRGLLSRKKQERAMEQIKNKQREAKALQERSRDGKARHMEHGAR